MITYSIIFLLLGLVLLIIGGDLLVRAAVSFANNFRVPSFLIGVTVVSFGTSAPELMVSIQAAFDDAADIAIGNIMGSNIANIALVLGISVIIKPIMSSSGKGQSLIRNISEIPIAWEKAQKFTRKAGPRARPRGLPPPSPLAQPGFTPPQAPRERAGGSGLRSGGRATGRRTRVRLQLRQKATAAWPAGSPSGSWRLKGYRIAPLGRPEPLGTGCGA